MITKAGIIGYNDGNGHPYSFSAILNGYEQDKMDRSPYPGITKYLSERRPEEFGVEDMKVTHIWAPVRQIAENIADCTSIGTVCDHFTDMIDEVDVVLILRDDAASHRKLSEPFLENGKTVFIDKPLCRNPGDLQYFRPFLHSGALMSCSGFRYYPAIVNWKEGALQDQNIIFSHNVGIIDWLRYGIHLLEGITPVMGKGIRWVQNLGEGENHIVRIEYKNGKFAIIQVNKNLGFILRSVFYTDTDKHVTINYDDNFSCFRHLLKAFYKQHKTKKPAIDPDEPEMIIKVLMAGIESLEKGGQRIALSPA